MKRFLAWLRRPQIHVHFIDGPDGERRDLAERAVASLQSAIANAETAVATAKSALAVAASLQDQLLKARSELLAYTACGMEPDAQIAELQRMKGD